MIDLEKKDGWGCQLFSNELHEGCLPLDDRDLIVQCKFRVFANRPKPVTLDGVPPECHTKFRDMFLDRLKEDLSTLRVAKIPCNDVKIISKDKKEFVAQKGILAGYARLTYHSTMAKSDGYSKPHVVTYRVTLFCSS